MTNFDYLTENPEYKLFSASAVEAEKVLETSPAMSAVGTRKALELAVKWVYDADKNLDPPYRDNLQALIHEPAFRFSVDKQTWSKLPYIIKLGNLAVHTEKRIDKTDAVLSLAGLFEFIQWIEYSYGKTYTQKTFSEQLIPTEKLNLDTGKIKQQETLLTLKDSEIKTLREQIQQLSQNYTDTKTQHQKTRQYKTTDITEYQTRKKYIDIDLKTLGWEFNNNCIEEVEIENMADNPGQTGFADYVLYGKDGLPLAVIEAKKTSKDPNIGKQQCRLYADSLEKQYGRRPVMFCTNGFETYYWDDTDSPQRQVSSIFSQDDLQRITDRRTQKQKLSKIPASDNITNRYYQKQAITAVCENIEQGFRKSLLVMATGTGKTRTAASITDILSRGGYITNVLFLADRIDLVEQAKDAFKEHLPDISLCNLLKNKDDINARIIFSTYPTILNKIDTAKTNTGTPLFTPAHFDLIIIDESHRSIFKKYRAIFDYFDAQLIGLTATPKIDIDRNTYEFFELEQNVPTFAYDYETAIKDNFLVPYYNIEVKTTFLTDGIIYDDLSEEDKKRLEEDFDEDGEVPEIILPNELNKHLFNQNTVDKVLQDLMKYGIKTEGGDKIGKTIIFAQNKTHAQYITERFDKLYPQYKGTLARRIVCEDTYSHDLVKSFKHNKEPVIAVSVDMMDTGIDVPAVVNLVFFKKVRSKTKFWQMIGRGTRLCNNLPCIDTIDGEYTDKRRFYIFDYLGNFEYFRENTNGIEGKEAGSLSEKIFIKQIKLIQTLQASAYDNVEHQKFRTSLIETVFTLINELNPELTSVKLKRRSVEKFSKKETFDYLSELDKNELTTEIAPLIDSPERDESAKRFDNFIYGYILALAENPKLAKKFENILRQTAEALSEKHTIPQIKEKIQKIKEINTDSFFENISIIRLEEIRKELRDLIKFLNGGEKRNPVYTNLTDKILEVKEGEPLPYSYDFEDYKLKVNRYIEQHKEESAIWKLRNNIKLTKEDYSELEKIFTSELGTKEDYEKEYGETPFGLLIRKIAKLNYDAAMNVFSNFISEQGLNNQQITFIKKIIDYVAENGYLERSDLMKPPFDRPMSFIKLFDSNEQKIIISLVTEIKQNALA